MFTQTAFRWAKLLMEVSWFPQLIDERPDPNFNVIFIILENGIRGGSWFSNFHHLFLLRYGEKSDAQQYRTTQMEIRVPKANRVQRYRPYFSVEFHGRNIAPNTRRLENTILHNKCFIELTVDLFAKNNLSYPL